MNPLSRRRSFPSLCSIAALLLAILFGAKTPFAAADEGGFFSTLFGWGSRTEKADSDASSTHDYKKAVPVKSTDGQSGVQTFCVDGQGRIVALVAPQRHFGGSAERAVSEVHVLSSDGEPVSQWKVDFHGHSINAGPDGNVYVAGDGKLAKFGPDGKLVKQVELPHIVELLKDKDSIRKQAEEQAREQLKSFDEILRQYRERIANLEKKPADKLASSEKRNLEQYHRSLTMLEKQIGEQKKDLDVEGMVKGITSRLRVISSVAVSNKDVFIVCGETTGYGYALWRMDHEFQNPKQIMSGLRGCCGQMDVQVQGSDVLVAANCDHAFARYDRDGKKLGQWGQASNTGAQKCFGGCCNPMNVRCGPNGDVFTAESEGIIKRFSAKGDFVSVVGKRNLTGGCKNVAVAASPDGKLVYFCDQPGSQIIILGEKPKELAQSKPSSK